MIALGLLTAPRNPPALEATLRSLRANGFNDEIHLFAEPGCDLPEGEEFGPIVWHSVEGPEPIGNWANWRRAATWLVENTGAPFIVVGDDDFRLCPAARPRLEEAFRTLPHHDFGFLSLYTPIRNLFQHRDKAVYGWQDVQVGFGGWGTVALGFVRETFIQILNHHETALFPSDRDADLFLCKLCTGLGLRTWYHLPSLVEHTGGGISTLNHPNFEGFEAVGFREDFGRTPDDLADLHHHAPPLVSCLMPTQGRPGFARQAIEAFRRQDYPNRELVVIECGDSGIRKDVETDPNMIYFQVVPYMTLGARRNLASRMAHGSLLSFWDDDDWHGPRRLSTQLEPILAGRAEVTALGNPVHYNAKRNMHYRATEESVAAKFYHFGIHTGTLAFKRELMQDEFMFPDIARGSDFILAKKFFAAGARLERIQEGDHYLYVQHGSNTSPLELEEKESNPEEWNFSEGLPSFLPDGACSFYAELSRRISLETESHPES